MFIRFDRIHERDGQTDRQTPHDDISHACTASRGKKYADTFDRLDTLPACDGQTRLATAQSALRIRVAR